MSSMKVTRRDLIKYSMFLGAALGLPRWKVFEVLEASGGKALAAEAACATTNRSVHIIAGDGGFSWFQLLWPHNDVAAAGNPGFAFHAPGEQTVVSGTDRTLTLGPEAPWKTLVPNRQVSAFMAGNNETHTQQPTSSSAVATGTTLFAACSALQSANPTLVPVIAVDNAPFGTATGAPRAARVGDADAIVDLFNSVASRAGGALANTSDAALFESSYKGFLAMHAAAGRPTTAKPFATGKVAANLLGKNLADQLRPTDADLVRYGITGTTASKITQIAKTLITTAKAFSMGLTSCVVLPAMRDDPHGAFNDMGNLRMTTSGLGMALDAFMNDLLAMDDPTCGGTKIGENTVISIHGDTPKDPLDRGGWPDGTPGNSNWMYVLGAGYLRTGWFGGIMRDGTVKGFNPTTGAETNDGSGTTAMPASAAVLFATARGDMRRVQDFYRGVDITGIVRPQDM
jgi:hypothetical protein